MPPENEEQEAQDQTQESLSIEDLFGGGGDEPAGDDPWVNLTDDSEETESTNDEGGETSEAEEPQQTETQTQETETESDVGQSQSQEQQEDPKDKEIRELRDQLNKLQGQLQQVTQAQSQSQESSESEDKGQEDALPDPRELYQMQLPQEMLQKLGSDDANEFQEGLTGMLNGLASTVHAQVRQEYSQQLEKEREKIRSEVLQETEQKTQAQSEAERIRKDFYGTYPEFEKPEVESIVTTVFQEEARRLGKEQYDSELRDAVGQRLRNLGIAQQQQEKEQPAKKERQPAQMSQNATGGTGRQTQPTDPNSPDFMQDLLQS